MPRLDDGHVMTTFDWESCVGPITPNEAILMARQTEQTFERFAAGFATDWPFKDEWPLSDAERGLVIAGMVSEMVQALDQAIETA